MKLIKVIAVIILITMTSCVSKVLELEAEEKSIVENEIRENIKTDFAINLNVKVVNTKPGEIYIPREHIVLSDESENKSWSIEIENEEDYDLSDVVIEYKINTYGYSKFSYDKVSQNIVELRKEKLFFNNSYDDVLTIDTLKSKEKINSDVFFIGYYPYSEIEIYSLSINGINQGYNIENHKNYGSIKKDYSSKKHKEILNQTMLSLNLIKEDTNPLDIKLNLQETNYKLWSKDTMDFLGNELIIGEGFVYKPDNKKWYISVENSEDLEQKNVEITYTIKAYKNEIEYGIDKADIISTELVLYAEHTDIWKIDTISNEIPEYKDIFYMWTFPYVEIEVNSVIVDGIEHKYSNTKACHFFEEFYSLQDAPHYRSLFGI